LLLVHYLKLVHAIVRKGLQRSYYRVESDLQARVRGKLLISTTVRRHHMKQRMLHTTCAYEEFGFDHQRNRLLKKALLVAERQLLMLEAPGARNAIQNLLSFVRPAFVAVGTDVRVADVSVAKSNVFFSEYDEALRIARIILRKEAYQVGKEQGFVITPPFWIDMSKLFELYVYGQLVESYPGMGVVEYHTTTSGNELDYLFNDGTTRLVIDAKYKPRYSGDKLDAGLHQDIRQLSGYARLRKIQLELNMPGQVIPCLILYPRLDDSEPQQMICIKDAKEIQQYDCFSKLAVLIPTITDS
jgi:5-methylcytosine-specific restriction enzyme subunit McrC